VAPPLADLQIVSTGFDVINAIDLKTKTAHSFVRRDRRRPPTPTPKSKTEVIVVTSKDWWKFTVPPPSLFHRIQKPRCLADDEMAKLIDKILTLEGDPNGNH